MSNVHQLHPRHAHPQERSWFDRECDTAIMMANDPPTLPEGIPLPWSALLAGPTSDPELETLPEPKGLPLVTFSVVSAAYIIGVLQTIVIGWYM